MQTIVKLSYNCTFL